jgi:uncharacterized membrane protein
LKSNIYRYIHVFGYKCLNEAWPCEGQRGGSVTPLFDNGNDCPLTANSKMADNHQVALSILPISIQHDQDADSDLEPMNNDETLSHPASNGTMTAGEENLRTTQLTTNKPKRRARIKPTKSTKPQRNPLGNAENSDAESKNSNITSASSENSFSERCSGVCDAIFNGVRSFFTLGKSIDERYGRKFTVGEKVADAVSLAVGSWRFVVIQSSMLISWLVLNVVLQSGGWDPYPFILLNLMLSFQAAYTAPIIMMSQNRGADVDRLKAEDLHEKVDHIRLNQMFTLWETIQAQTKQIHSLETKVDQLTNILTASHINNLSSDPENSVSKRPAGNQSVLSLKTPKIHLNASTQHNSARQSSPEIPLDSSVSSSDISNLKRIFPPVVDPDEPVGEAAFQEAIQLVSEDSDDSPQLSPRNSRSSNSGQEEKREEKLTAEHSQSSDSLRGYRSPKARSKRRTGISNVKLSFQQLVKTALSSEQPRHNKINNNITSFGNRVVIPPQTIRQLSAPIANHVNDIHLVHNSSLPHAGTQPKSADHTNSAVFHYDKGPTNSQ